MVPYTSRLNKLTEEMTLLRLEVNRLAQLQRENEELVSRLIGFAGRDKSGG